MKLLKFECTKIWKNKLICALILCIFIFNIVCVYRQTIQFDESRSCFPNDIQSVYEELSEVAKENRVAWMESEIQEAIDNNLWKTRINALRYVSDRMQEVEQYDTYLASIEEQATLMSESSLFSEQNVFSKRNAALIPEKYQHLHGLQLKHENSQGVLLVTDSKITDLCIVIVLLLVGYCLISMEREDGTMAFSRCTKNGVKSIIKTKLCLILIGSILTTIVFYGSDLLIAGRVYGFGDGNRWIQSVEGFITSPWKMTVWQFMFGFLMAKMFVMSLVASSIVLVTLYGKNVLKTTLLLMGVVVVEYGFYTYIPVHSWLDLLKKCNLFYLMRIECFFQTYETINVGGYPVVSWMLCGVFGTVLLVSTIIVSILSYEKVSRSEFVQKTKKYNLRKSESKCKKHSLLYYEAYKLLWVHGAVWIVLIALGLQYMTYANEKSYYSLEELYYKSYIKQLEGAVTEDKLVFVKEEGIRLANLEERIEEQEAAYHRVLAQTERIGEEGIFLNEVAYHKLLDKQEQVSNIGKLLIVFVLSFYPVFIVETTSGMATIWNSIPKGSQKLKRRKWSLLIGCISTICILFDIIFAICRMNAQEIKLLQVPISYLDGFESWTHVSVLGYLEIHCAVKIGIGILSVKLIELVSKKVKNESTVLLIVGCGAAILYIFCNILGNIMH